jgi:hypothetical protein
METFVYRYPELVKDAITAAKNEINKQSLVRDSAAKKVQDLRAIDKTSPYTCISSDAGQAEIAYNIEEARLCHEIGQLELIREWADAYLEYIKSHGDSYDFKSFHTFSEFYIAVNNNHINRLIQGHRFECKCQFFGYDMNYNNHHYTSGEGCCSRGVPVHLSNTTSAIKKIGLIGEQNPDKLNIYPVPNTILE